MKANEFFKAMGINAVRQFLENDNIRTKEMHDDLKRLVESHELVLEWKLPEDDEIGLDGANLYLDYYAHYTSDEEKAKLDRLKQAIADVESCMEVSSESN
ncbi:hypothetical protein [Acinetobacter towneri]|uniref:hypothetical protein n=1 Tax=Acinetobacter towneri TaxID=202956 RepID=UPI001F1D78C8|nr:hypothetical protein [Acinetobacter towneri]UIP24551.1 hypothetical protein LZG54_10395 [Acinetobacter towneri]